MKFRTFAAATTAATFVGTFTFLCWQQGLGPFGRHAAAAAPPVAASPAGGAATPSPASQPADAPAAEPTPGAKPDLPIRVTLRPAPNQQYDPSIRNTSTEKLLVLVAVRKPGGTADSEAKLLIEPHAAADLARATGLDFPAGARIVLSAASYASSDIDLPVLE